MLKARGKREVTYKGAFTRLYMDYSKDTFQARREWDDISKMLKEKKLPTKNLILGKAELQKWRKDKNFPQQTKAEGIHQSRSTLQQILKGVLWVELKQSSLIVS